MNTRHRASTTKWYGRSKRALDIAGSLAGLVALSPVMLLAAGWIMVMDGSPVFYKQWRVGRSGGLFRIWKFRTMSASAEYDGRAVLAVRGDPRVLRGCRWMRKTHIDELPQLINVLAGQMSLVGPRPERPEVMEDLRQALPRIERRLSVMPGLTGLAQVRHGYASDLAGMRRKLALDLHYVRRRSFMGDVRLLFQTRRCLWDRRAC